MVGLMTTLRECADTAAAALAKKVRASKGNIDAKATFKFHLNLQKRDKKDAIRILEGILSRLKS